ncbi:hypothetical protein EZV62_013693 [Acer yangbiense]|uniref:Receptor ligand binding region domain-containing protein n=1 Tax=Acer yangbiense TaxID=1000413 RepID=A0A5C7HZI7_9ROSI|nr:hypothetical protein EZV62_013693 [Acer yangbiense]
MAQQNNNNNNNTNTTPVNVGVVLDVNNNEFGKNWLSCINMALSDFYTNSHDYKTRLVLNIRDPKRDVVAAAAAALDLIKNVQVQAIIGPENSMQTNYVIDLGNKSQVPILSFSATNPSLTSSTKTPYFFRGITNDSSSQVGAITALIQAFGWREAVPIYVDNEFGQGVIPYLTDALQAIETRVPYRSVISPEASNDQIVEELYKLMTKQTRVFIVHMLPSLGSKIFAKAKQIGMMEEGFVWIVTDGLADFFDTLEQSVIDSMQGVLGVRPYVPRTTKLESFWVRWKRKFQQENPDIVDAKLNIFGLLAYDVTVALAMAVEKSGVGNFKFDKQITNNVSTDLEAIGVSENGPNLVKALSSTRFRGLTGDYSFVDGQLQSLAFQIVNVNGYGTRGIGFWTPEKKVLMKKLMNSSTSNNNNSASKPNLGPIIWPGDSTSVPKGWEIPTNQKKLHIGVPMKSGFSDFVKPWLEQLLGSVCHSRHCCNLSSHHIHGHFRLRAQECLEEIGSNNLDKDKNSRVILRPAFIYGTRTFGSMKVLQHAKSLNQLPFVGPLFTPPVNVTAVAKVAVRAATDPVFPPGLIDAHGILRYSQQRSR